MTTEIINVMMYGILGSIVFICGSFVGYIIIKIIEKFTNKKQTQTTNITPEEKENDLSLIYESLDNCIMTELHKLTIKDFKFDDKCDIKLLTMNSYRNLIRCLLHPQQYIDAELMDGTVEKRVFFQIFINKVYLKYISETPSHIKSLVFKYYSGYTTNEYFMDKKVRPEPSALPFITNYVRNYLWCRFEENEESEQKILEMIRAGEDVFGADSYESAMKSYDIACCRKLASNIYHSYDIVEEKTNSGTSVERIKKISPKSISEFAFKFTTDQLNTTTKEE